VSDPTILIIDDDPNVTLLLATKLKAAGAYQVETTNTADGVVALVRRLNPALIVCDIDLGEACGGDIASDLTRDARTAATPVVFLSSLITPEDMRRRTTGARMISKQLPMPEIIRAIVAAVPAT
jgi:CheY-like chemotaxis protein